jgi:hypothetical protein
VLATTVGNGSSSSRERSKTFSGSQLLRWLEGSGGDKADETAAQLLASNLVTLVSPAQPTPVQAAAVRPDACYRLLSDAPRSIQWGEPLNTHYCELGP